MATASTRVPTALTAGTPFQPATAPQPFAGFVVTNTNDSGVGSLRQAVLNANAASGADTVTFDPAVFNTPRTIVLAATITISDGLTISGPGANLLTVSGNNAVRIFNLSSGITASISGMTLTLGKLTSGNGAAISSSGSLTLSDVAFTSNTTIANGGAIWVSGGTASVTNCSFSQNTASNLAGAAIYNEGALTVTNSTFNSNTASFGGAIGNTSSLTVTGSTFTNNTVTSGSATGLGGGAIYSNSSFSPIAVTITDSTFSGNAEVGGSGGGGAIANRNGSMTITNSTFTGNTALDGGGAVETTGIVSITGSTFTGNSASGPNNQQAGQGSGGAISIENAGQVTIANSVISGNRAVNDGGGINYASNTSGSLMNITNTTISDNTANTNNDASGDGGGLYIDGPGLATVSSSTISGNAINNGRGGGFFVQGALTLDNSTVSDNFAGLNFGGIEDVNPGGSADQVHISNSTIVNNRAAGNVGGMGSSSSSDVGQNSLRNSIVANNSSPGTSQDVFGDIGASGYNLIKNTTGGTVGGANNIIGQDPQLGPLSFNGGPTRTHALLSGSPAIDKGASGSLVSDQRGLTRPFDDAAIANASAGNGADIGSFEVQAPGTSVVQFSAANYNIQEDNIFVTITVNRVGDTSVTASVDYQTSDGLATERRDYIPAVGKLQFATGETSKSFVLLINEDAYVEGIETINVNLSNPSGVGLGAPTAATVSITDDVSEPSTNTIDDPRTFVCQNYHDYLNRQPDSGGWDFWTNQTTSCGNPDPLVCRINASASFFLAIEFQETGYLVERVYKAAYGDATGNSTFGGAHQLTVPVVRFNEFLADSQRITRGVVVLQPGWAQLLESNKQAFFADFVQRSRFTTAFPVSMTPAQFVDTLNQHAGNVLSASERTNAISLFGGAGNTANQTNRAQVLRQVSEDQDLQSAEFNRAFVLMQYFGYLRRNPNDPQDTDYTGYDFWLTKLNQFNGNYINAEMIKAFLSSIEYRQRFAP